MKNRMFGQTLSRYVLSAMPKFIGMLIMLLLTSVVSAVHLNNAELIPYDAKLYHLAYDVFLANNNPADAFTLAKAAVKQKPQSLQWRNRLSSVALMTNHPGVALEQSLYLVEHQETLAHINKALSLAKALFDEDNMMSLLKLKLKYEPTNKKTVLALAQAEERLGEPEAAVNLLQRYYKKTHDPMFLQGTAKLLKQTGSVKKELVVLQQYAREHGHQLWLVVNQADALVRQGDVDKAIDLLSQHKKLAKNALPYWRLYADLSFSAGKVKQSKRAYTHVLSSKSAREMDYIRYLSLVGEKDPEQAYAIAKRAWQRFHSAQFMMKMLQMGILLQRYQELAHFLLQVTSKQAVSLGQSPFYWSEQARVWRHLGDQQRALKAYQRGLARFPHWRMLQEDYLWYLIDNRHVALLTRLLQQHEAQWQHNNKMKLLLAQANLILGRRTRAMFYYQQLLRSNPHNLVYLVQIADLLEQMDFPEQAVLIRHYAWRLAQTMDVMKTTDVTQSWLQLTQEFGSGDANLLGLDKLRQTNMAAYQDYLLAWALRFEHYDLALMLKAQLGKQTPPWAALNIALRRNDMPELAQLIKTPGQLPWRDRVTAFSKLMAPRRALDYLYKGLEEHPNDSELYQQTVDWMETYADTLYGAGGYKRFGELRGPIADFKFRKFIWGRFALTPYWSIWRLHDRVTTDFKDIPEKDQRFGIELLSIKNRSRTRIVLGGRNAVMTFPTAAVYYQYQWDPRTQLNLLVGFNQLSEDSTALRLIGVRDELQIDLQHNINRSNSVLFRTWLDEVRDQYRDRITDHTGFYLEANHKLQLAYPDITVAAYTNIDYYFRPKAIALRVRRIVADTASPTLPNGLFLPISSNQYGVRVYFGENLRTQYHQWWRPFASGAYFYDSSNGEGYEFDVGISGRVFGRDHLAFYLNQSESLVQQGGLNRRLLMSYRMYFV